MKIFFVIAILITFCQLQAQTITPTSTAAECIVYIDAAAKLYKGSIERPWSDIRFTGDSFTYTITDKKNNLIIKEKYKPINWSQVKSFFKNESKAGGYVSFNFLFESRFPLEIVKTNLSDKTSITETKAPGAFSIYIPIAEQEIIKDVEGAINRFIQLEYEKAGLTASGGKKPKEGTPSYAETIGFIQSTFADTFFSDGKRFDGGYTNALGIYHEIMYRIKNISFSSCNMTVEYEQKETVLFSPRDGGNVYKSPVTITSTIDLSQVEAMNIWHTPGKEYTVWGLSFNIKGQKAKTNMELPIGRTDAGMSDAAIREWKIYKAFNHLRKLCGAPDPISFD